MSDDSEATEAGKQKWYSIREAAEYLDVGEPTIYRWMRDGQEGHVRGVDVFRVRDGKVAEKLSYVKG